MLKLNKFFQITLLSFLFASSAFAESVIENTSTTMQYLKGITTFYGDRHNEFSGDYVAVLTDDSAWKVHPKDKEKFAEWGINDIVHLGVRTSFYWFKREHKFELHNMTRRESVRVMLVQLPYYPLTIMDANKYMSGQYLVPHTITYGDGSSYTYYTTVTTFAKNLTLSDGSVWTIKSESEFDYFTVGNQVYLGVNPDYYGLSYFLINGNEREARWDWAYRL